MESSAAFASIARASAGGSDATGPAAGSGGDDSLVTGASAAGSGSGNTSCRGGSGFAAFPDLLKGALAAVRPGVHPTALAVAELAAPRLAAGEGVDAAQALPVYLRDKVAFTKQELEAR